MFISEWNLSSRLDDERTDGCVSSGTFGGAGQESIDVAASSVPVIVDVVVIVVVTAVVIVSSGSASLGGLVSKLEESFSASDFRFRAFVLQISPMIGR